MFGVINISSYNARGVSQDKTPGCSWVQIVSDRPARYLSLSLKIDNLDQY